MPRPKWLCQIRLAMTRIAGMVRPDEPARELNARVNGLGGAGSPHVPRLTAGVDDPRRRRTDLWAEAVERAANPDMRCTDRLLAHTEDSTSRGLVGVRGSCGRLELRGRRKRPVSKEGQVVEVRPQAVEVRLTDRIGFVVVALGAGEREPEEDGADGGREIVEHHVAALFLQVDVRHVGPAQSEPRRDRCPWIVRAEQVACDLELDELVVREIGRDRADHPVAVAPSIRAGIVVLESVGLGEAREVEPQPRLLFCVTGRIQIPIDEPLVRVRARVPKEALDLLPRRGAPSGRTTAGG